MSKGKFYGCQHKNSDLEGLQSKSVIRNLLMKHKYNTFRIKNNILNKYSIPSQAMPLPPPIIT